MSDNEYTLKLYTPLQVDVTEYGQRPITLQGPDVLMNQTERDQFAAYHDAALAAVAAAPLKKDTTDRFKYDLRNLDAFEGLADNVISMVHTMEAVDGKVFGATVCRLKTPLNKAELSLVKGYCLFLYGENIFRAELPCPFSSPRGKQSFYIWDGETCTILTEKEMEKAPWRKPQQHKKGGDAR